MAAQELDVAMIDECAHELRHVGDALYWRYRLLEILIRNYGAMNAIK
ncbi:uncharacterized protein ACO6RY_05980 [Pungitius sinensis]